MGRFLERSRARTADSLRSALRQWRVFARLVYYLESARGCHVTDSFLDGQEGAESWALTSTKSCSGMADVRFGN